MSSIYICKHCGDRFQTKSAHNAHQKIHNVLYESQKQNNIDRLIAQNTLRKNNRVAEYQANPNICINCSNVIPYKKRKLKYCCKSCATSYSNKVKGSRSLATKEKISKTIQQNIKISAKRQCILAVRDVKKLQIPFSKLFINICAHCKITIHNIIRTKVKYCNDCKILYSNKNRARYAFTFNINNYPDLFDIEYINQVGWSTIHDFSKLSRDHKISVTEAIKKNYDPYYITHPLNCEIMTMYDNLSKFTKCSIQYNELKILVDDYDTNKYIR